MRLLYIADNDFSFYNGQYYYGLMNRENSKQYAKYFDKIVFIGRDGEYYDGQFPISKDCKVSLVSRYGIKELKAAMAQMSDLYDVVLVRNGFLGCFAAKYAQQLGKPLIAYCGADPYEWFKSKGSLKDDIIAKVWGHLEKKKMKMASYAYYCTEALYRNYPCSCDYMICSNVNISIDENALTKRLKKIESIDKEIRIGLSGSWDSQDRKGISTVIKAMGLLEDRYSFEVVGMGPVEIFLQSIQELGLENRVLFRGFLTEREQVNEWLDTVDIYLQPSLSEGLPRATIEAMSHGCPAIGSNVGGMRDLLPDDYIITPKDYKSLAEKIKLLSSKDKMREVAQTNIKVASGYKKDIRDKKMDDFFNKIVNDFKKSI